MRSCCQACTPYSTDGLSLLYVLSAFHQNPAHVQILGGISTIVSYLYIVSISAGVSCFYHTTGCCCHNRRAMRSCIICTIVSFPTFLYGVKSAFGKFRCNPEVFEWCF